jgi:hypothetical protein
MHKTVYLKLPYYKDIVIYVEYKSGLSYFRGELESCVEILIQEI